MWFGVRVDRFEAASEEVLRGFGLSYSAVILLAGLLMQWRRIKRHFVDAYLHVAANGALATMLSGLGSPLSDVWLAGLILFSGTSAAMGVKYRRFAFLAYGVLYGYVGITHRLLRDVSSRTTVLSYLIVTGVAVSVGMLIVSRKFGRSE